MGETVHACAVALGEEGVLITGPPGAGKSSLALALLTTWRDHGAFAALVADDRAVLAVAGGRLLATSGPRLEGRLEVRGFGILCARESLPLVRVSLVAELVEDPPRLPDPSQDRRIVKGVLLPHLALRARAAQHEAQRLWCVLGQGGLTTRVRPDQRGAAINNEATGKGRR